MDSRGAAVILKKFGEPEEFEYVNDFINKQMPLPDGYVLVRIKAASFNPVDYKTRKGSFGGETPKVLGADFAGIIERLGNHVDEFKVGDEVYGFSLGTAVTNGSYAEYIGISQHLISKKPRNLSFEESACLVVGGLTAAECVFYKAKVSEKQTVLITGATGGVGTYAVQLVHNAGARSVVTAGSDSSIEYLNKQLGVPKERIVDYRGLNLDQLRQKVIAANQNKPFDVALDLFGGDMKRLCISSIGISGQVVTIVEESKDFVTPLYPTQHDENLFFSNGTLHTVFIGSYSSGPESSWPEISRKLKLIQSLVDTGFLKVGKVEIVGTLSSETVKKAHRLLEAHHHSGKLAMTIP